MRICDKKIFATKIRHIFWKLSSNFAKLVQKLMNKYLESFDFPETVVSRYFVKQVFDGD